MASAKNMQELQKMIAKQVKKAIENVAKETEKAMKEGVEEFYMGGTPKMYERTGALGETPKVDLIKSTTNSSEVDTSFRAYYDTTHKYTTGKAPSMATVLDLANRGSAAAAQYHLRENVGKTGFIDRADDKIEKALNKELEKYFDKV